MTYHIIPPWAVDETDFEERIAALPPTMREAARREAEELALREMQECLKGEPE